MIQASMRFKLLYAECMSMWRAGCYFSLRLVPGFFVFVLLSSVDFLLRGRCRHQDEVVMEFCIATKFGVWCLSAEMLLL